MIERVSTHVLDTATGVPAAGVPATLEDVVSGAVLGRGTTDDDGRVGRLNDEPLAPGDYRVVLDVEKYWGGSAFHPTITVHVRLDGARRHYHVPVLAAPYSYTTYLGS